MALFFQILGVVFLLLIMFVVVAVLTIRTKIRGLAKDLQEELGKVGPPGRIHLNKLAAPEWDDPDGAAAVGSALRGLGFVSAGVFDVAEQPALKMEGWVDPSRSVSAALYEMASAGQWVDVYTHFQDGTRVTYANTKLGGGVDHAPGHDVQRFPGMDVKDLVDKFLSERAPKPAKPVAADTFAETFERVYADEMDWRNSRGGTTAAEIRRIAQLSGQPYNEDLVDATRFAARSHAARELRNAVVERFRHESNLPDEEWDEVGGRLLVVHDRMEDDEYLAALGVCMGDEDWDEDDLAGASGARTGTPRSAFATFNARLPEGRRCQLLGRVREPIEADLYVVPESDD